MSSSTETTTQQQTGQKPNSTRVEVLKGRSIFVIHNFLSAHECRDLIQHAEKVGFAASDDADDTCQASFVAICNDALAAKLFGRLDSIGCLPGDMSAHHGLKGQEYSLHALCEHFIFYKYEGEGQCFARHKDASFFRVVRQALGGSENISNTVIHGSQDDIYNADFFNEGETGADQATVSYNEKSFYTLLVYLNNVPQGGETRFYELDNSPAHVIKPELGKCVVYLHRQDHDSCPVTEHSCKYVIRTDVLYRKLRTPEEEEQDEKRKEYQLLKQQQANTQTASMEHSLGDTSLSDYVLWSALSVTVALAAPMVWNWVKAAFKK